MLFPALLQSRAIPLESHSLGVDLMILPDDVAKLLRPEESIDVSHDFEIDSTIWSQLTTG